MSRQRRDLEALTAVARVRDVQRRAAEIGLARATVEVRQVEARKAEQLKGVDRDQQAWSQALQRGANPQMLMAWSAEVDTGLGEVRRLDLDLAAAELARAERVDAFRSAQANCDVAETLRDEARRGVARTADEARLNDLADRSARERKRR